MTPRAKKIHLDNIAVPTISKEQVEKRIYKSKAENEWIENIYVDPSQVVS